ncbi:HD domain-containing protein [Phytomonospora sp. NPDC050363]|uniref:HD domain-containing protein n=1 Tax=Phytomonospora sp. NPDC050363 TaxID=3155642 RepID=UPI0033E98C8C
MTDPTAGTANYLLELGLLKRARRSGWWIAGIRDPESIAEHSWRTSVTGMVIASLEGADPARTAMLCTLHDTPETRIGDIPKIGRDYLTAATPEAITRDQTAGCPEPVATTIRDAITEFEAGETLEAVCARDADKLECLIQAVEYGHQGVSTVGRWIDSSLAALKTASARAIAQEVIDSDPLAWEKTRHQADE